MKRNLRYLALVMFFAAHVVIAHVTISPRESPSGQEQRYTMRVPTERDAPTVRIEAEVPARITVTSIDPKQGWRIESTKNADGLIVGIVWSGGSIAPGETEEFGFMAQNPDEEASLAWRVIQRHADGSRAEWTGEPGSRTPAPITVVRSIDATR